MSEENKTPEINPAEEKAMGNGWVPQDQWEGAAEDWVTAKQFNEKGDLIGQVMELKAKDRANASQLKALENAVQDLSNFRADAEKVAYDKAIKALKTEKLDAIENGEGARVLEIDDKIDELKDTFKETKETKPTDSAPQVDPAIQGWLDDPANSWYHDNLVMQGAADKLAMEYGQQGLAPADMIKKVEATIKEEFKHKFKTSAKYPATNDSNKNGAENKGTKTKFTKADLTPDQQKTAELFVQKGVFESVGEYIEQLEAVDGIKQ